MLANNKLHLWEWSGFPELGNDGGLQEKEGALF